MNDAAASALMALFLGGSALGGLLGGYLGDKAAQVRGLQNILGAGGPLLLARLTMLYDSYMWLCPCHLKIAVHVMQMCCSCRCRPNMAASSSVKPVYLPASPSQFFCSR